MPFAPRCWILSVVVALGAACGGGAERRGVAPDKAGGAGEARKPEGAPAREALEVVRRCRLPAAPARSELRVAADLVYGQPNGKPLHLDVVTPVTGGPHPVVVLLHGGAWENGDEDWMSGLARALAGAGWAAATVEYRLVDERAHRFPGPIADVRCAVRWLRANAPQHGLDPSRMVALGGSAGGHLAAMLAVAPDAAGLDDGCPLADVSPEVQGAIAHYAPHDLTPRAEWQPAAEAVIARLLGAKREQWPERAALASPIEHVDVGDPPMVLVHGTRDDVVDASQSARMRDRLVAAGVPAVLVEVEGGEHGFHLLGDAGEERVAACTSLALLERVRSGRGGRSDGGTGSKSRDADARSE